jgi:hypothetical protein
MIGEKSPLRSKSLTQFLSATPVFGSVNINPSVYNNMNKRLRVALLLLAAVLVSVIGVVELRHRVLLGHFTPLALHADVTVSNGDIGIPGITKLYAAHITNFGVFPRRIERCEFLTDAFAPGVSVGYHVQQLDVASGSWHTAMDSASEYCRPYPLGIIKARLTSKLLWPGQTLSTGQEATGARGNLKGQTVRFAVVVNGREFPTSSFVIDEQVEGANVNYREKH